MFFQLVEPREAQRFKRTSYPALFRHLRQHTVDVVVLGNRTDWTLNGDLIRHHVHMNGYTPKGQIQLCTSSIWRGCSR